MDRRKLRLVPVLAMATALFGVTTAPAAGAATFLVHPGQSIEAAINQAPPGATIIVSQGTYHENLVVYKDNLRLIGVGATLEPPAVGATPFGICIAKTPSDCLRPPDTGPSATVSHVQISGFTVQGFPDSGMFVFGGDGTRLTANRTLGNGGYGIFDNSSSGTTMTANTAIGSREAGFYIGDSPAAAATLTGNRSSNNGFGFFIRNAEGVQLIGDTSEGNCAGVVILADAPGPAGHVRVSGSIIKKNNKACPGGADTPAVSGIGVISAGGNDVTVSGNVIDGNQPSGDSFASGGVVVGSAGGPGSSVPINNVVRGNTILRNLPDDIVWDGTGTGNVFVANACATSQPSGLCP